MYLSWSYVPCIYLSARWKLQYLIGNGLVIEMIWIFLPIIEVSQSKQLLFPCPPCSNIVGYRFQTLFHILPVSCTSRKLTYILYKCIRVSFGGFVFDITSCDANTLQRWNWRRGMCTSSSDCIKGWMSLCQCIPWHLHSHSCTCSFLSKSERSMDNLKEQR